VNRKDAAEKMEEDVHRYYPLLFAIAYRMLGSASDAEDIAQDCYVRYVQTSPSEIHSLKSYLTTIVTRLCLDHLKSARVQREQYLGLWLPEPVRTANLEDVVVHTLEQRESIATAFLLLLERLTPYERAVLLLHEVFDYRYEEIAEIVGKSAVHCRQLLHQAKEHLGGYHTRFVPAPESQQRLVERFLTACQEGNLQALIDLLAEDVTWWADGGGKVIAAPYPLQGRDRVLRLLFGLLRKAPAAMRLVPTEINGSIGLLAWVGESLFSAVTFEMMEEHIHTMYEVANPDKLVYLQRQMQTGQNEPSRAEGGDPLLRNPVLP